MQRTPPTIIDALNDLDDHVAAELLNLLHALSAALEQHYAGALANQRQREWAARQTSLWTDDDPPF